MKVKRKGNRYTEYEYNKRGQIIRADYFDGYWEVFEYNKIGLLIAAQNPNINVVFTRNKQGWVTQEKQGEHVIDYQYDEKGNLLSVESSLGADISYERNKNGLVTSIKTGKDENEWIANIKHNMLGLEIERSLPGGIKSTWSCNLPLLSHTQK
ncbi:hypothetical protein [Chryseobacterium luteum]|uniref:Sugar-binding protein n=1 Tax=Chryseobacterium luteum TaxID=421531 RepID=A0A085ZBB4_9FLAO|nr:hypothetical protein [Chryseobacterium luteum]KFF01728.1 hypothetical protein IX38_16815 [Chryseobacterium luteum]